MCCVRSRSSQGLITVQLMDRAESHAAFREAWTASGGLRSWARSAAGIEVMTTEQADAFEAQFDQAVTRTQFAPP